MSLNRKECLVLQNTSVKASRHYISRLGDNITPSILVPPVGDKSLGDPPSDGRGLFSSVSSCSVLTFSGVVLVTGDPARDTEPLETTLVAVETLREPDAAESMLWRARRTRYSSGISVLQSSTNFCSR